MQIICGHRCGILCHLYCIDLFEIISTITQLSNEALYAVFRTRLELFSNTWNTRPHDMSLRFKWQSWWTAPDTNSLCKPTGNAEAGCHYQGAEDNTQAISTKTIFRGQPLINAICICLRIGIVLPFFWMEKCQFPYPRLGFFTSRNLEGCDDQLVVFTYLFDYNQFSLRLCFRFLCLDETGTWKEQFFH